MFIRVHPWFEFHWKSRPQGALDPMALGRDRPFFAHCVPNTGASVHARALETPAGSPPRDPAVLGFYAPAGSPPRDPAAHPMCASLRGRPGPKQSLIRLPGISLELEIASDLLGAQVLAMTGSVRHCEAALGRSHNVIARPPWAEAIFDSTRDSPVVRRAHHSGPPARFPSGDLEGTPILFIL